MNAAAQPSHSFAQDDTAVGLPGWIYSDRDFFELEKRTIFRTSWQLVCHTSDIPRIGDYHCLDLLGESVVVVRGEGDTALLPQTEIAVPAEGLRLGALLTTAGLTTSNSEATRKLKERAVRIDAAVVEDAQQIFHAGFEGVLQVGKRNFARVRLVGA